MTLKNEKRATWSSTYPLHSAHKKQYRLEVQKITKVQPAVALTPNCKKNQAFDKVSKACNNSQVQSEVELTNVCKWIWTGKPCQTHLKGSKCNLRKHLQNPAVWFIIEMYQLDSAWNVQPEVALTEYCTRNHKGKCVSKTQKESATWGSTYIVLQMDSTMKIMLDRSRNQKVQREVALTPPCILNRKENRC